MAAEVVIRPVRPDDAEAVYVLRLQPSSIDNTMAIPSERVTRAQSRIDGSGPDDHVFVAVLDGEVVGMAGLHVGTGKGRHCADLGIMVHDRFQGRGIGRKLMDELLRLADDFLGLARVELQVYPDNARAIALYESCGFEHEGRRRKCVWRHGELQDVLMMGRVKADRAVG